MYYGVNNRMEERCCYANDSCTYNNSKFRRFINAPYPKVVMINISWFSLEVSYLEALQFSLCISQRFYLKDMYKEQKENVDHENPEYILKGVVCFLGAHYMSFVKQEVDGEAVWKLYDDTNISTFRNWPEVIQLIMKLNILPTLLIYEQINEENKNLDKNDGVSERELEDLLL